MGWVRVCIAEDKDYSLQQHLAKQQRTQIAACGLDGGVADAVCRDGRRLRRVWILADAAANVADKVARQDADADRVVMGADCDGWTGAYMAANAADKAARQDADADGVVMGADCDGWTSADTAVNAADFVPYPLYDKVTETVARIADKVAVVIAVAHRQLVRLGELIAAAFCFSRLM